MRTRTPCTHCGHGRVGVTIPTECIRPHYHIQPLHLGATSWSMCERASVYTCAHVAQFTVNCRTSKLRELVPRAYRCCFTGWAPKYLGIPGGLCAVSETRPNGLRVRIRSVCPQNGHTRRPRRAGLIRMFPRRLGGMEYVCWP
jgi:hypothetical protein